MSLDHNLLFLIVWCATSSFLVLITRRSLLLERNFAKQCLLIFRSLYAIFIRVTKALILILSFTLKSCWLCLLILLLKLSHHFKIRLISRLELFFVRLLEWVVNKGLSIGVRISTAMIAGYSRNRRILRSDFLCLLIICFLLLQCSLYIVC